ncbi:recombination protein NinB [Devosia sp. FJ2-5-3]|uniref:recombination protein NinB n=1 Tax=Devosia sp. FJ2-5-3 TaxID=2976680 RepID=UPI0023D85BE6|nr:recombination protein NinB [Devosia sp. FJ2-5-3]WEJ60193.1 recombination protein NinB [Devosia sp. FJ2-5-3]
MARQIVTLANQRLVGRTIQLVREAFAKKPGSRVEIKGPKRSNDQNAAMWSMLGDISAQLLWHVDGGRRLLDVEEWKLVMLDALRRENRDQLKLVPNTDHTGFVNISGTSSSDLEHEEMRDLLTIIRAFGDQHGVVWSEPKPKGDPRPAPPPSAYEDAQ